MFVIVDICWVQNGKLAVKLAVNLAAKLAIHLAVYLAVHLTACSVATREVHFVPREGL